jgi:hypothetical protein
VRGSRKRAVREALNFHVHGLAPVAADADLVELGTHGICGACGRRCTLVPDGRLGAF